VTRPAIETANLSRDFNAVRAVDRLTLEVRAGSIFGFLGPNGAGKTTMIRLLLGLIEPSEGEGKVLGFDIRQHGNDIRRRTGALFEHTGLYERLSAYDNLDYFGRIWRMPETSRRNRVESLMRHFGLWERRAEVVGSWDRGMQQKLAIARTLLHQPPLVFLDEPTAGLDPVAATALRKELAELSRSEGVTIFLTTHNLAEAE
jgi:ABC-2 type transport system ATP-binding protein